MENTFKFLQIQRLTKKVRETRNFLAQYKRIHVMLQICAKFVEKLSTDGVHFACIIVLKYNHQHYDACKV